MSRLAVRIAVVMLGTLTSIISAAPQSSTPIAIWPSITYLPVAIPGETHEQLTFHVSSGGQNGEPSHLRLDLMWGSRGDTPTQNSIRDGKAIVVKLHTSTGVVEAPGPAVDWIGIGSGGWTQWSVIKIFPWARNALDEAWFEVHAGGQTWWVELPYGYARNPEDAEIPDRTRGVPQFPSSMRSLGDNDILVPWQSVRYELGRSRNNAVVSLQLSNPYDASASAILYHEPPMRVGPDTSQWSLDNPRTAVSFLQSNGRTLAGRELARRLSDDRHTRTDDFTFNRNPGPALGRSFGTITLTIDDERFAVRVPSSVFVNLHGRTDPENKKWMR